MEIKEINTGTVNLLTFSFENQLAMAGSR